MKQKKPFASPPKLTELTAQDKFYHYISLTENHTMNEQTQLACLKRLRKTFGIQPPALKKD